MASLALCAALLSGALLCAGVAWRQPLLVSTHAQSSSSLSASSSSLSPSSRAQRQLVDTLKGLGIAGTLQAHLFEEFTPPGAGAATCLGGRDALTGRFIPLPLTVLSNGFRGVHLMFVLSGFANALSVCTGTRRLSTGEDARRFYADRARRLLPPLVTVALFVIVLAPDTDVLDPRHVRTLALLCTFGFAALPWHWDGGLPESSQLWSLGTTASALALFPWVARLMRLHAPAARPASRAAAVVAGACLAVRCVFSSTIVALQGMRITSNLNFVYVTFGRDSILGRMDDFVCGAWCAAVFAGGWRVKPGMWTLAGLAAAGCWILLAFFAWDYGKSSLSPSHSHSRSRSLSLGLGPAWVVCLICRASCQ